VIKIKDFFFKNYTKVVGNGVKTRFWEDFWINNISLSEQFNGLYKMTINTNVMTSKSSVKQRGFINFRRNCYEWNCYFVNETSTYVWKYLIRGFMYVDAN
jgi:hypothetical protein